MLNQFIKKQRTQKGLSQEYLAKKLEISRPTYKQVEDGTRDITVTEARKLADVFDMTLEDFLREKELKHSVILEDKDDERSYEVRVNKKDLKKFKQVLLYILEKVGAKKNIGETVIHKLLYFIDFDYYEKYEENLMGGKYIKNVHGPTSVELGKILKNMEENEEITKVVNKYFRYSQKKYLPLKDPDLSNLSAREVEHIDWVLARLSDKNAKDIEKYSHEDIPWKTAKDGGIISYESVFYRDDKYSVKSHDDEL